MKTKSKRIACLISQFIIVPLKIRKQICFFILLFFSTIYFTFGQIQLDIDVPPSTDIGSCKTSSFQAVFTLPTSPTSFNITIVTNLKIGTQIVSIPCPGGGPPDNPITFEMGIPIGATIVPQGTPNVWTVSNFTLPQCTIPYTLKIDCRVTSITTLHQDWLNDLGTGNEFDIHLDGSPASTLSFFEINNLRYVSFADPTPGVIVDYPISYLQQSFIQFDYVYTGNYGTISDPAYIDFIFTNETSCASYEVLGTEYSDDNGANWYPYSAPQSVIINNMNTISVRQTIKIKGCLFDCNPQQQQVKFSYRCSNILGANHCEACELDAGYSYSFFTLSNPAVDQLKIERLSPSPSSTPVDLSCPNTATTWQFKISNNGTGLAGAIKTVVIQLSYLEGLDISALSLIKQSTIQFIKSNPAISITNISYPAWPANNYSCSTYTYFNGSYAVSEINFQINDLNIGEDVILKFDLYKCCEQNTSLYDVPKFFNHWGFSVLTTTDACTGPVVIVGSNNVITGNTSGGGISPQSLGGDANLNLQLDFSPTVSDLGVPSGGSPPVYGDYVNNFIDIDGLLGSNLDLELLGCGSNDYTTCIGNIKGILEAVVICEMGLRIENPTADVLLKSNSTTFTFNPAWTGQTATGCAAAEYHFFYDLSSLTLTDIRDIVNHGRFYFKMQACCLADQPTVAYEVRFNLMMNPDGPPPCNYNFLYSSSPPYYTCSNCCFLPLTSIDNVIAVHCPGCRAPGIIVDAYKMERETFGYKDSDNDGIADSPLATFTKGSTYYNNHELDIDLNHSMHGDRVGDYLTAHFEQGDLSNPVDYGYLYTWDNSTTTYQFWADCPNPPGTNQRGEGELTALQLKRRIPYGENSFMNLTPVLVKLYVDNYDPGANDCIDCELYNGLEHSPTDYKTVRTITLSGAATITIPWFEKNTDYFFFTFTQTDLDNAALLSQSDNSYFPFLFKADQQYRMYVQYKICGNYAGNDAALESVIENKMWLSGVAQTFPANLPLMPNNCNNSETYDQTFADSYLFICETFGGRHYFYRNYVTGWQYNTYPILNGNQCGRWDWYQSYTLFGKGTLKDHYNYEFREPKLQPKEWKFIVPINYTTTRIDISSRIHKFIPPSDFPSANFSFTATGGTLPPLVNGNEIIFNTSGTYLPDFECYNSNPDVTKLYTGDQYTYYSYEVYIKPDECTPSSSSWPINTVTNTFNDQLNECGTVALANCSTITTVTNSLNGTLVIPAPLLQLSANPITVATHTICWTFTITNTQPGNGNIAFNVYFGFDPTLVSFLTNFILKNAQGTIIPLNPDNIYELNQLYPLGSPYGPNFITLQLCADYDPCATSLPVTFPVYYGWNCSGYPTLTQILPPNPDPNICSRSSASFSFTHAPFSLQLENKFANVPNYASCVPFTITTEYKSGQAGAVLPTQVQMTGLPAPMQITDVIISNCGSSTNPICLPLPSPKSIFANFVPPDKWDITLTDLDDIGYDDCENPGYDNYLAFLDKICIDFVIDPGCSQEPIAPIVNLSYENYCGDGFTVVPACTLNTLTCDVSASQCTDCFTAIKNANPTLVGPGPNPNQTVTFDITVCNNSSISSNPTVWASDLLPPDFTLIGGNPFPMSFNLAAGQCSPPILISGYFNTGGTCNIPEHINTVNLSLTNGGSVIYTTTACVEVNCAAVSDAVLSVATGLGKASDLIAWNGGNFQIQNFTFTIDGTFIVDMNIDFIACNIYMESGAGIVVLPTCTLNLDNTSITGCTTMWNAITLNGPETMIRVTNGSRISDAETGIIANHNTAFEVSYSDITECVTGIRVPQNIGSINSVLGKVIGSRFGMVHNTSFRDDFFGQNLHGNLPLTGIELNDCIPMTIGDYNNGKNEFHDLNTGITVFRSRRMTVQNSQFRNVTIDPFYQNDYDGTAIVSMGDEFMHLPCNMTVNPVPFSQNTVYDSHRGIYTHYSSLQAKGLRLINLHTGIRSEVCTHLLSTLVQSCSIEASFRGIDWFNNDGASFMKAISNQILMSGNKKGIAINAEEINLGNTANYLINGNYQIDITEAFGGIRTSGVDRAIITNNNIFQNSNGVNYPSTYGIIITGGDAADAHCNYVECTDPTYTLSWGLFVSQCQNNAILCNNFNASNTGVFFDGDCNSTRFQGNTMQYNDLALYVDNTGIMGPQTDAGNSFWNYSGPFGGDNINLSPFGLLASRFRVHTSLNTSVFPNLPWYDLTATGGPDDWFVVQPGQPFSCSGNQVCGLPHFAGGGGDDSYDLAVAADSTTTAAYIPESKSMAREYLFEKLSVDSVLLASDTLFESFYAENDSGSVGKLYLTKKDLTARTNYNSNFITLINLADSLIGLKNDSISMLDSLSVIDTTANYEILRQNLVSSLNVLQQTRQNLVIQQSAVADSSTLAAGIKNSAVVTQELPEVNTKFINGIYIKFVKGGRDSIASDYPQILAIAQQCPSAGGPSVYRARTFVSLFYDTLEYDDAAVCLLNGMYRQQATSKSSLVKPRPDVMIIPNPADNRVDIVLRNSYEGICKIEITNAIGSSVITDNMSCKEKSHSIDTRKLSPGVYIVKVHWNGISLKISKLIIAR